MKKIILPFLFLITNLVCAQEKLMDAVWALDNDNLFFIKGSSVVLFDKTSNTALEGGKVMYSFPGVNFSQIDAILEDGNGKIFIFSGNEFIRFDRTLYSVDPGYPKLIEDEWSEVSLKKFQAAISLNGKSYFFKDGNFIRYDQKTATTDPGYPKAINEQSWPGLTFTSIDAAMVTPSGKIFFFKGDEFISYDIKTNKADAGYPKNIESLNGLKKALNNVVSTSSNNSPPIKKDPIINNGPFEVEENKIKLSPYSLNTPEKVIGDYQITKGINGEVILGFQQNNDAVILKVDSKGNRIGKAIELKNYWLSSVYPMRDGSMAVMAGKVVNNNHFPGHVNTLYFIIISSGDVVGSAMRLEGGIGERPGQSWYDGRDRAMIDFNGTNFGIFLPMMKNYAEEGKADDIHQADMFLEVDRSGTIIQNTIHRTTTGHSNSLHVKAVKNHDFWTMTIGDKSPFGLHVYNHKDNNNFVAWPPKEDIIPYDKCKSVFAAGQLYYMDETSDGNLIAVLGTVDHPNIGMGVKVDPLFLKMDKSGKILMKKYLKVSPHFDESYISVSKMGENYLVAFGAGNNPDNNWQAEDFEICIVDDNANFILPVTKVPYPFAMNSQLMQVASNEFVWCVGESNAMNVLSYYKIKIK